MRIEKDSDSSFLIEYKESISIENDFSEEVEFNPKKVVFPIQIKYFIKMPRIKTWYLPNPILRRVASILQEQVIDEKMFGFYVHHDLYDTVTNTVRKIQLYLEELNEKYSLNIAVEETKQNLGILLCCFFGNREPINRKNITKKMEIIPQKYIEINKGE